MMRREESWSDELITVDRWDGSGTQQASSGIPHIGGSYGDQRGEDQSQDPPTWVKWWAQEQRILMETLANKLVVAPSPTPREKMLEAPKFKLNKMTAEDDPEAYLNAFERMATMAGWPQYQWTTILVPNLTGPLQIAVDTMPLTEVRDYAKVKKMILSTLNVSEETHRTRMRETKYEWDKGARWLANLIRSHGMRWLKPQEKEAEEIVEMVWLEQFIRVIPEEAQAWVLKHTPQTLEEAVEVMENFEAAERMSRRGRNAGGDSAAKGGNPKIQRAGSHPPAHFTSSGRGNLAGDMETRGREPRPGPNATSTPRVEEGYRGRGRGGGNIVPRPRREGIRCFRCDAPGHVRRECPWRVTPRETAWTNAQVPQPLTLTSRVLVNKRPGLALIDSGCNQTLARKGWVTPNPTGEVVRIRCVHGDVRTYPTGETNLEIKGKRARMRVGVAANLPYDIVLGRDWPFFPEAMGENPEGRDCMEGEKGSVVDIGEEQRQDPSLLGVLRKAKEPNSTRDSEKGFFLHKGRLYRRGIDPGTQETVEQLVLPQTYRKEALEVAHDCPLGGAHGGGGHAGKTIGSCVLARHI